MAFPIGAAVAGANAGLVEGGEVARRAQVAQYRDLQMQEFLREQAERQQYRALVPRLLATEPETAMVGGRPARFVGEVAPGTDPEAAAFRPTLDARPGVTVAAPTMGGLTRQLGPEAMATIIAQPEGRELLKAHGVVSDEEFQKRKRRHQAQEEFKNFGEDMEAKYTAGDPLGALLAERAGYRVLAAAADDPAPLLAKANELTKVYATAFDKQKKDETYKKDLAEDGQRYAKAMADYRAAVKADGAARAKGEPGDSAALKLDALVTTLATMKTDPFQKKRDGLFAKLEEGLATQIQNEPLTRLYSTVGAVMNRQSEAGQTMDCSVAFREAFRANPDAVGTFIDVSVRHKTSLSECAAGALGVADVPKTDQEEAARHLKAQGILPTDPRWIQGFTAKLTEIEKSRQKPAAAGISPESRTAQRIQAMYLSLGRESNSKRRSLDAIKAKYTYKPGDPTAKPLEEEIKKIEDERANLYQQFIELTGIRPSEEAKAPPPAAASDPAALKVARDGMVEKLYPGKAWTALTPKEKQAVATSLSGAK